VLHVAQISFANDAAKRRPAELLEAWSTVADVAKAAACAGVRVSVIQACAHSEELERNGARFHFLPFGDGAATRAENVGFHKLIGRLGPDVLHVQGLGFSRDVIELARAAPKTPILLQDRANRPPRRIWRWPQWRRALSAVRGVAFCAKEQAEPFKRVRLMPARTAVYEVPATSTSFTPGERTEARGATGLAGDPCVLWVGHLNHNKDPSTVLEGISLAAKHLPNVQLWCCFGEAPLMKSVQRRIEIDPRLAGRVHLLGRVAHERIELLMRAADFFVSGSHREGCSFSIIEALACALPPVVTDIPSSRALIGSGAVGALWPRGNAQQLMQALLRLSAQPQAPLRAAARSHFERELSFAAVGRKLQTVYEDLAGDATPATRS
jgi:glycosyltransferase involved in cell wall biosynthesis